MYIKHETIQHSTALVWMEHQNHFENIEMKLVCLVLVSKILMNFLLCNQFPLTLKTTNLLHFFYYILDIVRCLSIERATD